MVRKYKGKLVLVLRSIVLAPFVILFLLIFFMKLFFYKIKKARKPAADRGEKSLLHISSGASTEDVIKKFGTLNFLFSYDGNATEGIFKKNILYWFPSKNTLRYYFDEWIIFERRLCLAEIISVILFFYDVATLYYKYDILLIRAWDPYLCGLWACILSFFLDVPFCVSIHSDYDKCFELDPLHGAPTLLGSRRLAKRLEKFVLHKADLVMPIREHLAEQVVCLGVAPERVKVIPHGIDLTPFEGEMSDGEKDECRRRFSVPEGKHIVSFVGRLSRENYVYDIIEMVRLLRNKREDFALIMAGGGNEERALKKLIESDEELKGHVRLTGFISHEEAIKLRRISDVNLVLMGGFSLIEACASGKPVVAYDVEWHNELIRHGETGSLVPEGDVEGLVSAVDELLSNPEKGVEWGEKARRLAFDRHSLEAAMAVKRECYRELLRKGEGASEKG